MPRRVDSYEIKEERYYSQPHIYIHIIKHQIQNKLDTLRSVIVIPDARQFMCISATSSDGFLVIHVN